MHCGAGHRSWVMKSANVDISRRMHTEDVYTHRRRVFSHKGEPNGVIRGKVDGTGDHHFGKTSQALKENIGRQKQITLLWVWRQLHPREEFQASQAAFETWSEKKKKKKTPNSHIIKTLKRKKEGRKGLKDGGRERGRETVSLSVHTVVQACNWSYSEVEVGRLKLKARLGSRVSSQQPQGT